MTNTSEPVGPNADTPRGAPAKDPKAIAQGKGPISFPEPEICPRAVDGEVSPAPGDATQAGKGEQPHPPIPNQRGELNE